MRLDDAQQTPQRIAQALQRCRSESRPVYIELPRDQVFQPCAAVTPLPALEPHEQALDACVDELLARLGNAQSPVLMVGVEIRRYDLEDKVATLAHKLDLPVVTSFMGRGLLADADAPLLGTYLGVAGSDEITQLVENSDALLLLGVIISDTNLGVSEQQIDLRKTIQVADGQVSLGYHVYHDIPLTALVERLLERTEQQPGELRCAQRPVYPYGLNADDQRLSPTDIATAVNDMMAEHGRMPIAADMGDCLFTALDMENTELVAPGYYATMGYGVPAGLGRPSGHWPAATDFSRRWCVPDDWLGAWQLPTLWLEPHCTGVQ